jgi:DNA replication protein DnaC
MAASRKPNHNHTLNAYLDYLKLSFVFEHYLELAKQAAQEHHDHITFLAHLLEGEVLRRQARSVERRMRLARFPVRKTLADFDWTWPRKLNRLQVQNLFRLHFIEDSANVIFIGGVGLGKSHLATALGLAACGRGYSVLFASAVDVVNTLAAARAAGNLKAELRKYLRPRLLVLDELGYLPIDKVGADLLFQIISQRYERGAIAITTNRVYKKWPEIFNNDATLTSAVLDRLLHHAETVKIEGKSYRMKDQINEPGDSPTIYPTNEETSVQSTE